MNARAPSPCLHELVAARICHDLVSPLGAIGNGLELLSMAGGDGSGGETGLIGESAALATARLKLLRLAFGPAGDDRDMRETETAGMVEALQTALRLRLDWQVTGNPARPEMRCACLALMGLGASLIQEGSATVTRDGSGHWQVQGRARRIADASGLWAIADGRAEAPADLAARLVHFAILPQALAAAGRRLAVTHTEAGLSLSF